MLARFGEKLKTLRTHKGLTLVDLAPQLGLKSHSYLSELEGGRKTPTAEMVLRVSEIFGVSADDLLRDDREVPPCH